MLNTADELISEPVVCTKSFGRLKAACSDACCTVDANLLELELNDSKTPVSRVVYLISMVNS